jgi:hypothetical protein
MTHGRKELKEEITQGPKKLENEWNFVTHDSTQTIINLLDYSHVQSVQNPVCPVPPIAAPSNLFASFVTIHEPVLPAAGKWIDEYLSLESNKSLKELIIADRRHKPEKRNSAHPSFKAKLKDDSQETFSFAKFDLIYDLHTGPLTPLPKNPKWQLEPLNWQVAHYLAPQQTPQRTCAIYDKAEDYHAIGVDSEAIANFKTAKEVSLTGEDVKLDIPDLIMEYKDPAAELKLKELKSTLEKLSPLLNRDSDQNSTFLNSAYQATKNGLNYLCYWKSNSAAQVKPIIDKFTKDQNSVEDVEKIIKVLKARSVHIKNQTNNSIYTEELNLIDSALSFADYIFRHPNKKIININVAKRYKKLEQILRQKKIDLTEQTLLSIMLVKYGTDNLQLELQKLRQEFALTEEDLQAIVNIEAKHLRKYRIHMGNGKGLEMARIQCDSDRHINNMDLYGNQIDFDHFKEQFLFYFTQHYLVDWVFRKPNAATFIYTERDSRFFPILVDAAPWYFPTRKTKINKSIIDALDPIYNIGFNLFSDEHNEIYAKFAVSLLFHMGQFEVDLKYLITDIDIFKNLYALHLSTNWFFCFVNLDGSVTYYLNDDTSVPAAIRDQGKNLFHAIVEDEVKRLLEVRKVLVNMPEFNDFLIYYGNYAMECILEEIQILKAKFEVKNQQAKINNSDNSCYENLVNLLNDTDKFKNNFTRLCQETAVANEVRLNNILSISQGLQSSQDMNISQRLSDSERIQSSQLVNSCMMTDSISPVSNAAEPIKQEQSAKLVI